MRRVLVTGGAGYVGSMLVPHLLGAGYRVTVYDTLFFGAEHLPQDHPALTVIAADIRDRDRFAAAVAGQDAVLHLACISNDASFELDEQLSTSINFDAFEPLVVAAKAAGVRRFVYCSSSSVYGVSDAPAVTEEHPLLPLTLYNKFKGLCEPILFRHQAPDFVCVTVRPATICGYGRRQRLDLTVNILTNHAVNRDRITVFGGTQLRPNLHIDDMVALYRLLLEAPDERVAGQIFNAGQENLSVQTIAERVRDTVTAAFPDKIALPIEVAPTNDIRSYHINSDKIARVLGWRPRRGVADAVADLVAAFQAGLLPDSLTDSRYFNVQHLKAARVS